MMETKDLSLEISQNELDSDGLLSWEEFYGSSHEDLVTSFLEMYDLLIGRSSEIKDELIDSPRIENGYIDKHPFEKVVKEKVLNNPASPDIKKRNTDNWCDIIKRNWNCRCTEKSVIEAVTRCAACDTKEPRIRSTDIRDSKIIKSDVLPEINGNCRSEPSLPQFSEQTSTKCELVTCPAGFSTPTTPVQQRLQRLANQSPLALKRNENGFRCVTRPSSVSSLASSSSSSSSTSSCFGARRLGIPHKSSAYLASIESLEDDSDIENQSSKDESCRFSKESEGSEDSGVHSPCTSLPQHSSKYCDPHLSYMDKVVMEIIETEEVYVGDLRKIIEGYLFKWRSVPNFPLADRLETLFGNIEAIFHFNSLFLSELEQCGLDPVKVARCFVKNNSGFSVYTEYCTNYPRTVSLLTELMRQEGTVRLFRERQTALQHTLPLGSYLLKPVQRILKYHLLLQNMVKQYSNGFDGYKDIVDALRTMTEIAQHINDMKRRHEHEVRVQEIQSLLLRWEGEDLTTYGELCAEGAFRMYGAKAARHVFLFDKMVLITKKKEGGILSYKAHINCSNLMLIESVPGEPLSFHIIPFDNPKLQYTLQCRSLEQKREWTLQLKRVILENYNAVIPSHARQLVMELGQSRSEDENLTNKLLPKRQHLAPEYLEKRKQDKRKTESGLKSRLRKNKKIETGDKSENQFNKVRSQSQKVTAAEKQLSNPTKIHSDVNRRKSESEIDLYTEDKETEDTGSDKNEEKPEQTEKLEIKSIEQIVAQILKQNREFDKILKRQKQTLSRGHGLSSRRKKKKDMGLDDGKNVYETLKNYMLTSQQGLDTQANESGVGDTTTTTECRAEPCSNNTESTPVARKFSKISLDEDLIPTSPSVWLRQQTHLPTPTKKAGSLPRSFQIGSESLPNDPRCLRDFRTSIERPFTIASDKLPSNMLFESMERFCKSRFRHSNSDNTEDGSLTEGLTTPGASLDQINIHPEYKIYRSSLSANILKNMLSTVQNKFSQIKPDLTPKTEPEKKVSKDRKASRVVYLLAKHYHKTLRNMQKNKSIENELESDSSFDTTELALAAYKQGSSSIGARLANFAEADYRINKIRPSKKAAALLGVCGESVLSLASPTATPDKSLVGENCAITYPQEVRETEYSDESEDSFYERSFEAMDEELLKDKIEEENEALEIKSENCRTPPPVPVKPNKELYLKKIVELSERSVEENLEDVGSQSLSPVENVNSEVLSKGWVRHVVGKIQGGL